MANNLVELEIPFTTAAGGGVTVTSDRKVNGKIIGVGIDYGDAAGTTTIAITDNKTPARTIMTLPASNTDIFYDRVKIEAVDTNGAAIEGSAEDIFIVDSEIKAVIANGGATKSGKIIIQYEEYGPQVY